MSIYDSAIYKFLTGPLNDIAWLYILLPCVFIGGIYLTIGSGAVQFRRFAFAMKNTVGKMFKKQEA
jgi:Na+/alanine symporter